MRFEDITLEDIDIIENGLGKNEYEANYLVSATDELIEVTNKIRAEQGNIDLVGVDYDNDVYYTYYLIFNADKKEISLQAEVAHGEKDDFVWYTIDLFPEEKEMLTWKIIKELLVEIEDI